MGNFDAYIPSTLSNCNLGCAFSIIYPLHLVTLLNFHRVTVWPMERSCADDKEVSKHIRFACGVM